MRQETNNEMDLLLRRLGRHQETSVSSDHLDADELSSFAENVLPPAARARYTEHLAECARCRDLIVQLSSSAGVVVAQETAKVSAPSALRKFLASLFSPMVLRYAVPALGLVIVAAIGFMVSRNERADSSIAEVRQQQPAQAPLPASQPQSSSSPVGESHFLYDRQTPATKTVVPGDSSSGAGAAAGSNAAPAPVVSTDDADTAQEKEANKVERKQAEAEEAPPPKPTPVTQGLKKLDAEKQRQADEVRVATANEPPAEKAADASKKEEDYRRSAAVTASRAKRAEPFMVSPQAAGRSVQRDDAADKDKNDADTRTVAGRHFRKQDNVWIDTAYKSSQSTTDVRRGSEQYRILVGDEPEIKQIADQLGGEIIVVWKSRAYRIR